MAMINFYKKQNQLSLELNLNIEQKIVLRKFFDDNFEQLSITYSISNFDKERNNTFEINEYMFIKACRELGKGIGPFLKIDVTDNINDQETNLTTIVYKGSNS